MWAGEILITNLNFLKDERLTIKGRTAQMSDIFKFITLLEDSPYFKDIQTRYTTRRQFKGVDLNEFELICPVDRAQALEGEAAAAEEQEAS